MLDGVFGDSPCEMTWGTGEAMDWKTRVPRLRTFLLTMLGLFLVLMFIFHYNHRRGIANSKATGLGSVAGGWDPIGTLLEPHSQLARSTRGSGLTGDFLKAPNRVRITARMSAPPDEGESTTATKQLVQAVGLQLLVKNAQQAASEIERIAATMQGDIEKADLRNDGNSRQGEIVLRVPASKLEEAVVQFSRLAIRVQEMHRESRDITREYMDSQARLRNLKLEEDQYLVLLRRAGSMKDTLQVTEKVSEVRGEIEQLQGDLNWQTHQVAMSAIHVQLVEEAQATMVARWRPIFNAKTSALSMLADVGEWVDWVVALIINIPLIALWVATIGGLGLVSWRVLRWIWLRFVKSPVAVPLPG